MYYLFLAPLIGYLTSFFGFLPGVLVSAASRKWSGRANGGIMGFTGGLLLAFISFEVLPKAFEISGLPISLIGIFLGIFTFAAFENKTGAIASVLKINGSGGLRRGENKFLKTGIMLTTALCLHNIPEGMAIGSLFKVSLSSAVKMAAILGLHCIPESIAIAVPLRRGGGAPERLFKLTFLFALPMSAGALLGYVLSGLSTSFASVFLGFSGGVMIYVTCGEILPESKVLWNGRFTAVCAGIGFLVGLIFTSVI